MANFDYSTASEQKSVEQKVMSLKGDLNNMADKMNYYIDSIMEEINALRAEINELKKGE